MWQPKYDTLIGVIGGIGPEASAKLYQYVIELRQTDRDDGHIPLLIFNNPQIPNNNEAATGAGPPSLPAMIYTAQALQRAGTTHIVIPCNTAHIYVEELQRAIHPLPIINMLKVAANAAYNLLKTKLPNQSLYRVGLMGTIGTTRSKVYQRAFYETAGASIEDAKRFFLNFLDTHIELLCPSASGQERIQDCIGKIKAGGSKSDQVFQVLLQEAESLIDQGVQLIVIGKATAKFFSVLCL